MDLARIKENALTLSKDERIRTVWARHKTYGWEKPLKLNASAIARTKTSLGSSLARCCAARRWGQASRAMTTWGKSRGSTILVQISCSLHTTPHTEHAARAWVSLTRVATPQVCLFLIVVSFSPNERVNIAQRVASIKGILHQKRSGPFSHTRERSEE